METIPAQAGWLWIKQGFALFRKQPAELSTLFVSYMFFTLAVGIIPIFGQLLPTILMPIFSMAFMQACVNVEQGKPASPKLLLSSFRSPASRTLWKLGGLYLLAVIAATAASSVVDGGVFWQVATGQIDLDEKMMKDRSMSMAMLFTAALSLLAPLAFWFVAPLVAWKKMTLGKAVFYSIFSVRRTAKAFLVYGLAWLGIYMFFTFVFAMVVLLTGSMAIGMILLMPVSILMLMIIFCSFYPSYVQVFGKPEAAVGAPPASAPTSAPEDS